jgi:hypothetical protein
MIKSLRELGLGGNKFTGDIPDELCNLTGLERVRGGEGVQRASDAGGLQRIKSRAWSGFGWDLERFRKGL